MDYGTPMQNQNKGYAKQEKKDLMKDMPIDKRASGGSAMPMMGSTSFMSKHSSAMRMMMPDSSPSPMEKELIGEQDTLPQSLQNAIEASPAKKYKDSAMKMKGSVKGDQSASRSDYAMDSGKTDKGYKGKTGSSKGDQSASKADYKK